MFSCLCGAKTNTLRYKNGKKVCNNCDTQNFSGQFERRLMQERAKYAKDVLQPRNKDGSINKDYEIAYGKDNAEAKKSS